MEIVIITICVLSYVQVSTCSALHIPDHFYVIDPNRARKLNGNGAYVDLQLKSHIPFLGASMCENYCQDPRALWVGKNGVMEYRKKNQWGRWNELRDEPYRMGRVQTPSSAIIAPLWTWLRTLNGTGTVYYQQTSKPKILQQAQADVRNNFHCGRRFIPTSVLIVTWYNMPFDTCISDALENNANVNKYCACRGTHDHDYCLCNSYTIEEYCTCHSRSRNNYEQCRCHEYFLAEYGSDLGGYCSCLIYRNEARKTCDCYMDRYWEDLAYCRYQTTGVMDYAYCEWAFDWVFCECAFDEQLIERLGENFVWGLCDCTEWGNYMYECMCPSASRADLCSCLTTYEEHLSDNLYMNYVKIIDFCECMINGSGDEVRCGCSDCPLDPAKRELLSEEAMVKEDHVLTRERKMVAHEDRSRMSVVHDDAVEPWSEDHNTFQVVMVTDGRQTYVIYNYESLNVPQYLGNDKHPAVVGFDGYGSSNGFENIYSYKSALYRLLKKSNVGMSGRWMYRVDGTTVVEPADC